MLYKVYMLGILTSWQFCFLFVSVLKCKLEVGRHKIIYKSYFVFFFERTLELLTESSKYEI